MAAGSATAADDGCDRIRHFRACRVVPEGLDRCLRPEPSHKTRQSRLPPLGTDDSVSLDEEMADPNGANLRTESKDGGRRSHVYIVVLLFAASIYLGTVISPPSLMDDVDAVQAQIARNMLTSGDWVTAR